MRLSLDMTLACRKELRNTTKGLYEFRPIGVVEIVRLK